MIFDSQIKSTVRSIFRRYGYDIVKYTDTPKNPPNLLNLAIQSRIANGLSNRFLQIGANDGVRCDPIREIVLKHRLQGVLVEPLPDMFDSLRKNYADHPDLAFEQCAIGEADGEATIFRLKPDSSIPDWLQGIASFDRGHLTTKRFGVPGIERLVEPVQVPVLTVSSLMKKHDLGGVDLLQVDTEGFDCKIVQWAIQAGLRPAVVNYEYYHSKPHEQSACKQLLQSCGYKFLDMDGDTLALLED